MGKHPPSTQKQPAKSYVEASLDHNDRYPGVAMAKDGVPRRAWRKGSQWFAMTREHATIVAEDVEVFEAFEKHCNVTARRAAGGGGGGGGGGDSGGFRSRCGRAVRAGVQRAQLPHAAQHLDAADR